MDKYQHPIKLVIIDFDRTFLYMINRIHHDNVVALKRLISDPNIQVAIISGRCLKRILKILIKIGLEKAPLFISSYNGALIYDVKKDKVIYHHTIPKITSKWVIETANKHNMAVFAYASHQKNVAFTGTKRNLWLCFLNNEHAYEFRYFNFNQPEEVSKFLIKGSHKNSQLFIDEVRNYKYNFSIFEAFYLSKNKPFWEINAENVDKREATKWFANHLKIKKENIMAIGDGNNDVNMLGWVGLPVAVGNARPEVKKIAKYITLKNSKGGVAKAINKFI